MFEQFLSCPLEGVIFPATWRGTNSSLPDEWQVSLPTACPFLRISALSWLPMLAICANLVRWWPRQKGLTRHAPGLDSNFSTHEWSHSRINLLWIFWLECSGSVSNDGASFLSIEVPGPLSFIYPLPNQDLAEPTVSSISDGVKARHCTYPVRAGEPREFPNEMNDYPYLDLWSMVVLTQIHQWKRTKLGEEANGYEGRQQNTAWDNPPTPQDRHGGFETLGVPHTLCRQHSEGYGKFLGTWKPLATSQNVWGQGRGLLNTHVLSPLSTDVPGFLWSFLISCAMFSTSTFPLKLMILWRSKCMEFCKGQSHLMLSLICGWFFFP